MRNNFDLIKEHLTFYNEKSFYFIQIIKRKKENPEMTGYSRPIESFYVFNKEQFERFKPNIIEKCEQNRARAYIKMNTLDAEKVGLMAIRVLSERIDSKDWKGLSSNFNVACGQSGSQAETKKLYLMDIDNDSGYDKNEIREYLKTLQPWSLDSSSDKVVLEVPTQNGIHYLTTGFEINKFKQKYPNIDVHKDGITLLYYPNSCDL